MVILVGMAIGKRWHKQRPLMRPQRANHPERLFDAILNDLELEEGEKKLLKQMAAGARLKHPALALVSPGLLAWAVSLWRKEQGIMVVTDDVWQQLEQICVKIFDHQMVIDHQVNPGTMS